MRLLLAPIVLALSAALAGCSSPGGGGSGDNGDDRVVQPGLAQPVTVYEDTLDFSADPAGAERSEPLAIPAGARVLTLSGEWRPTGPVAASRAVFVEVRDSSGGVLATCDMESGGLTEPATCGPTASDLREGESYTLAWGGFGNVELALTLEAS